ncbi:MAG: type II 3-dehydroquinate dehydratase [Longimicrobiaceae bacterium]
MAAKSKEVTAVVLHGPNLNLLGQREVGLYGASTLEEIDRGLTALGAELGVRVRTVQSNSEGALIDAVHAAAGEAAGLLVNAGGYTHTSVALRDALLAVDLPFVEVHLSNLHAREPFRRRSLLSDRAAGVVQGFGAAGYRLALRGLVEVLRNKL